MTFAKHMTTSKMVDAMSLRNLYSKEPMNANAIAI
jgi:hypothetical protein